jgi:hypothetical protein
VGRSTVVAIALAGLVVAAGAGWIAGRRVRSPAEEAARTAAPTPSLITVPVENRRLTSDVVTRGAVGYGTPTEVSLPASTLKGSTGIVTVPPAVGAVLNEGAVALAVSARPVLVFQGVQPAYRDLNLKSVGQDVRDLEAGLARLGLDPGPQDAVFDAKTVAALRTVYNRSGYDVFGNALPADEIVFFPTLPVRVEQSEIKAGESPSGPVMAVTGSKLTVTGDLPGDDAKLVRKGAAVVIADTDQGIQAGGTVVFVDTAPGTHGVDAQRFYVEVEPKDLPPALVGATVVLTIVVQSTEAEVLAVPLAALSAAADGTTRVEVQVPSGGTRFVTVRPGLVAKGLVAVVPLEGALAPGDLVVVGVGTSSRSGTPTTKAPASTTPQSTTSPGGSSVP